MSWNEFIYFAVVSLLFWFLGVAALYLFKKRIFSDLLISAGLIVFATFIVELWIWLGHPARCGCARHQQKRLEEDGGERE
jgi:hypothetical protein